MFPRQLRARQRTIAACRQILRHGLGHHGEQLPAGTLEGLAERTAGDLRCPAAAARLGINSLN